MRSPTLRWWLLCAGIALTAIASVIWVVDGHGSRVEFVALIIYCVLPTVVPLGLAQLPSPGFQLSMIGLLLVELYLLVWGGWPLIPAVLLQLAALLTRRPAPARVVARPVLGALAGTAALLLVTEFLVIPVGPDDVIGCIDPALSYDRQVETNNAIFDAGERSPSWEGATGVGDGVAIELDDWVSDVEVDRVVARVRAIDGVTRVVRDADACPESEQ